MPSLSDYITDTRRLLHDSGGTTGSQFFQDPELTDYVNLARNKVAADTGCLRSLQTYTLIASQDSYAYSALPLGTRTIDIWGINVIYGSARYPLDYLAWTEFRAKLSSWTNWTQMPCAFSKYGTQTVYIGPSPSQAYVAEFDTIVLPVAMVSVGDVDTIAFPYTEAVPFYAAYRAKLRQQVYQDANAHLDMYRLKCKEAAASNGFRRIYSVYGKGL